MKTLDFLAVIIVHFVIKAISIESVDHQTNHVKALDTFINGPEIFRVRSWAEEIGNRFKEHEEHVVHRAELLKSFADVKSESRNGSAIVDKVSSAFHDLLERRVDAAENIMRRAEELANEKSTVPSNYMFNTSKVSGIFLILFEGSVH
ncbi:hypothetical protein EVAR_39604_1 [Eumeta japonica]|uniref:Uncharacterized protein n=1 Tax=Eumeta variegata TaxID=151549 RepID=A0A4C1Y1A4_EUMVA|nr:hypothetical protein EVAR_39604_1 [Eumeta japonica]